jgi:hypothetical protein
MVLFFPSIVKLNYRAFSFIVPNKEFLQSTLIFRKTSVAAYFTDRKINFCDLVRTRPELNVSNISKPERRNFLDNTATAFLEKQNQ